MTEYEEEICSQLGIEVSSKYEYHPFVKSIKKNGTHQNMYFINGIYRTKDDICDVYMLDRKTLEKRMTRHPDNPSKWIHFTKETKLYLYHGIRRPIKDIVRISGISETTLRRNMKKMGWDRAIEYCENMKKQNKKGGA